MGGLTVALLREHKWSYLGAFLSAVLASALITGSVSLVLSSLTMDGVSTEGLDRFAATRVAAASTFMATLGGVTAVVAIIVSVILVSSTMSFVVQGRRRELALLRLAGAGRKHVAGLILRESALLGLVAGVIGSLFAVLVGRGYIALFGSTYSLPEGFTVYWHPEALIIGILLTAVVTLVGAYRPAVRIGKVQPIEALTGASRLTKPMTLLKWVTGVAAGAGAAALFLAPADLDQSVFVFVALLQGLLALIALVQLAPVVVAPIERAVCGLVGLSSPGAGTLAQGHAAWDRARTAELANPALLLLAVPGVFFVVFNAVSDSATILMDRSMHSAVVVEYGAGPAALDLKAVADIDGVQEVVPQIITRSEWFLPDAETLIDSGIQLLATDLPGLARAMDLEVSAGALSEVVGTKVAVLRSADRALGERFLIDGPAGRTVEAEVVAVVSATNFLREVLVDAATWDMQDGEADYRTAYVMAEPGVPVEPLIARVAAAAPGAKVLDRAGWSKMMADDGMRQATTSLLIMLGGSCLLAVLAIGVSILTSLRERRGEFALSRRAGADEGLVHGSTLLETAAVLTISFALAAGVIAVTWGRVAQNFAANDIGILPAVPGLLWWFVLAGTVMGFAATVGGTAWALRSVRVR